ncbi:outer membrane lipoprotein carrier protein LolA [Desulfobotulus sp.]|jgi:outer membrane lipoprotein carrier protein|uniref:LolA family protein n=1 Tax=Desulfobotulus sp. TaxID=1940337 RepID=UPI002A35E721|nr:outer membrane lipoprotein carrier protein LolA [Desulfobotulus sp.]MDY0163288.1 outer membrane lipoprotein carrier protein LolA [Desulfobotulus sp.]
MHRFFFSFLVLITLLPGTSTLAGSDPLGLMESRYGGQCFSAHFQQVSILAAMGISERAEGRVVFAHPGRMRWEYENPEPRLIVTDGHTLWIHSPLEKEVLRGDAAPYFGKGKGGRFLSDMASLREDFTRTETDTSEEERIRIRLFPKSPEPGLTELIIETERETGRIISAETLNAYGDVTRIRFFGEETHRNCPDSMFIFTPPPGTQIFELAE